MLFFFKAQIKPGCFPVYILFKFYEALKFCWTFIVYHKNIKKHRAFRLSRLIRINHSIFHLNFLFTFLFEAEFEGACCYLKVLNQAFSGLFWPKYQKPLKYLRSSWPIPRRIPIYVIWRSYNLHHKRLFSSRFGLIYWQRLFYQHSHGHT